MSMTRSEGKEKKYMKNIRREKILKMKKEESEEDEKYKGKSKVYINN